MKSFKIALAVVVMAAGSAAQAYQLPQSWLLSEGRSFGVRSAEDVSRDSEEGIDEIFDANRDAVESAGRKGVDVDKWHLEFFTADLGVTAGGTLGVLALKGTPAVQVYWRRRDTASARETAPAETSSDADLVVTDESTGAELGAQAQAVARALERSGRIRDAGRASAGLARMSERLQSLMAAVPENPGYDWWLATLRLDVSLDASGTVYPGVKAGASARVRLDFSRLMRKKKKPARAIPGVDGESLNTLVSALAEELDRASKDEAMEKHGFEASSFRIGIGIGASGEIGIVKAGASTMGHLIFSRVKKVPSTFVTKNVRNSDPILMLGAGARGLEPVALIERGDFRKGMEKSLKMGRYFAKRAEKANRKKKANWAVSQIKTMFDMSVTGDVGVAKLTGSVSSELVFKNTGF